MHATLSNESRRWAERARRFADEQLQPWEVEAELNDGELPAEVRERHQQIARELGLSAMDVPETHGGLGLAIETQVAVWEQLGRVTNALCWCFSEPQGWMFEACDESQIERFILPLMQGTKHECYAITEGESGSDVAGIESTARAQADGYHIDGEKWYVTSANFADYFILQAKLTEGAEPGGHALFFVDMNAPGVELVRTPLFSHTYAAHHPTYRFTDVVVPLANRLGAEGDGMDYARSWFRRERLMIAARCCGRGREAHRGSDHVRAGASGRRAGSRRAPGDPVHARRLRDRAVGGQAHDLRSGPGA